MAKSTRNIPAPEAARTKYQKFEAREIRRSSINPAPYNPRTITDDAGRRLKANIKRVGLLDTLVWNSRTGNLVSGHRRLERLDELEGYPAKRADYLLTAAVVDLDEKTEREQNLFFNNPSAQGEYDFDALAGEEWTGIDFDAAGFTDEDLAIMDQDFVFVDATGDAVVAENTRIRESTRDRRKKAREQADADNEHDFFVAVVFATSEAKRAWCVRHGLDEARRGATVRQTGQV